MGAPFCAPPINNPLPNPQPVQLPYIPPLSPTAGGAAIANSFNAMKQAIEHLAGQTRPAPGGQTKGQPQKPNKKNANKSNNDSEGRWVEVDRTTDTVKIYDPNDDSVYVEVKQINKLEFQDNVTGETWTWTRG